MTDANLPDILRYIEQQWTFMAAQDCTPVKVALQLKDSSSLGLMDQYDQFQETHKQLQNALKVIVNEHHQGFNSSIGTFHKIQAAIQSSQQRVRQLKAGLVAARGSLASAKPELRAFAHNSQNYDSMLATISTIEALQLVPERLEAQVTEKRFLGAVDTLQEALKMIRKPEMEDIGALSDLRVYLGNQEHSLADILIEELHGHLYLKSPYCEERWKSHAKRDASNTTLVDNDRGMATFLESYDGSKEMREDPARNPESDTFHYIQLLVESLNKMSRLEIAADRIEHRLPIELFRVVERSHTEVEQRHPHLLRAASSRGQSKSFREGMDEEKTATLNDLLNTLYAKFEAIAEGHRVLFDVSAAIIKREGLMDAHRLNRSFRELWKLFQSEIRSLLHDHLASDGDLADRARKDNNFSVNIFRAPPRDRNRRLFKLADTDERSTELATEREDLEFILKASVPGLVNSNAFSTSQKTNVDDAALPDRSATGHKLLVAPSVFNMGALLPPSLSFLTRLREIVPPHSGVVASTLTSFLDDFLINVFYPQLDETLMELVSRTMIDMDAFVVLPSWAEYSSKPVFKGTVRFFETLEGVCRLLDALPHDQYFSQLVVGQMRAYYDRCYGWSKAMLQRAREGQPKMRLAAELATSGEVSSIVNELMGSTPDATKSAELTAKETDCLIAMAKDTAIEEADLINDRKTLGSLSALHTSMKWLAARCQTLRYISPRAIDMSSALNSSHHGRRWANDATAAAHVSTPAAPYLPLDASTALEFDGVVSSFTDLSTLVLRTLHLDLRLHVLHALGAATRATYALKQPYNDPDPAVLALSADLAAYDTQLAAHLLPHQYAFLTGGLHVLASAALVALVALVPAMDRFGLARMQLNVMVLQQCLKNVQPDGTLRRAERFYRLADGGCEGIVTRGVEEGFDAADLRTLVKLMWSEERDGKGGSVEEYLKRLGG